ncbi:MAG: sigma-70 family RNA polymerase sigma factor [Bacteroidaceae bacterium]|nr:sigma-70 family RNA polymerase sigma factor [Bacteroidaceae bacterium]
MRNASSNIWKKISDAEYIAGLKKGDNHITESFFYGLCNYMFNEIKYSLMANVDYDELVNELFVYLSKDNWHKLDTFAGINGCSLCSWVTRIAWRYFLKQRDYILGRAMDDIDNVKIEETTDNLDAEITMDVNSTFERMANKRYVQVLQWMLVDGYNADEVADRLGVTVANVYNIKHRAIVQFVEVYNAH